MPSPFFGFSPAPNAPAAPFFGTAPLSPAAPFLEPEAPRSGAPFWQAKQVISGYDPGSANPFWPTGRLPADGPGNDVVVVGRTGEGQYRQADLTDPLGLGVDLSGVISLEDINQRPSAELEVATRFAGGVNRLFVYGDADFTHAELSHIDWIVPVKAQVTLTARQLQRLDPEVIYGDAGESVLRIVNDTGAPTALSLDARLFSQFQAVDIGENVTLVLDQSAVDGLRYISGDGIVQASPDTRELDFNGVYLSVGARDGFGREVDPAATGGIGVEGEVLIADNAGETLVGGQGDDRLIGGAGHNVLDATAGGDNILRAGAGRNEMYGGAGDDAFVLLGDLSVGGKRDTPEDTFLLGEPLSGLNGQNFALGAEGIIDGGAGHNTLHVYGNADLSAYEIRNIDSIIVRSDVIFTARQLQGVKDLQGDGRSVITIHNTGHAPVEYDLSGLNLSGVGQIEVGHNVTLRVDSLDDLGGARILTGQGAIRGKDPANPVTLSEDFTVLDTLRVTHADGSDARGGAGRLDSVVKASAPGEVANTVGNDYLVGTEYGDTFRLDKGGSDVVNARGGDDTFLISGGGAKTLLSSGGIDTLDLSQAGGRARVNLSEGGSIDDGHTGAPLTQIQLGSGGASGGVYQEAPENNVMLILDVSGSMSGQRLRDTQAAVNQLLDAYERLGEVAVRLVTFDSSADSGFPGEFAGGAWMAPQTAREIVASLSAGGGTDYAAALDSAMAAHGVGRDPVYREDGARHSFFLSDGQPNSPVSAAQTAEWQRFLMDNQITSNAIGFGTGLGSVDALRPIAFDGVTGQALEPLLEVDSAILGETVVEQAALDFIENLTGTAFDDELTGNSLDNVIIGTGGDNTLTGLGGDDTLTGTREGSDTAVYRGNAADYTIEDLGTHVRVTDSRAGRDGVDTLRHIDTLRFADGDVSLVGEPEEGKVVQDLLFSLSRGLTPIQDSFDLFNWHTGKTDKGGLLKGIGGELTLAEHNLAIFDQKLAGFDAAVEYLLDGYVGMSLPVNYALSTGTMDIDYGIGGVSMTLPEALAAGETFEVVTGVERSADERIVPAADTDSRLTIGDDVGFSLDAGLQFDWKLDAKMGLDYGYSLGNGYTGGDYIDFLGKAGDAQGAGKHVHSFAGSRYVELIDFSSLGAAANALKVPLFDKLAGKTPFGSDGTFTYDTHKGFKLTSDLNNFKLFGDGFDSSLEWEEGSEYFSVLAQHVPEAPLIKVELDVDDALGELLSLGKAPQLQAAGLAFKALDGADTFAVDLGAAGTVTAGIDYALLSLDLSLGLSPATQVAFNPTGLGVSLTPSWNPAGQQSGLVGDTFSFSAPDDDFVGALFLEADYELTGELDFGLGISLAPQANLRVMSAGGEIVADTPILDFEQSLSVGLLDTPLLGEYSKAFFPEAFRFSQAVTLDLDQDAVRYDWQGIA